IVSQIPTLKKKYLKYKSYMGQAMDDIFPREQLDNSIKHQAQIMETSVLLNNGNGTFTLSALPLEAQFAPVFAIAAGDFDADGIVDIVTGGNLYRVKPEVGRYDAGRGLFLKGNGDGTFEAMDADRSGIHIEGELRDFLTLRIKDNLVLLGSRNSNTLVAYYSISGK